MAPAFALASVESFDASVVYAAPRPDEPLKRLIAQLARRVSRDLPPYGGIHGDVVPHVTLAEADAESTRCGRASSRSCPSRCRPLQASLVEEFEPRRWRELDALAVRA